jgi:hypothetical protein
MEELANRVVALLGEIHEHGGRQDVLPRLAQLQELLVNCEPLLLDMHLDEILQLQHHANADVRKAIIAFCEEAGRARPTLLHRILPVVHHLLTADRATAAEAKRAIQCAAALFPRVLYLISQHLVPGELALPPTLAAIWDATAMINAHVLAIATAELPADDGQRTAAIKCIESIICALSLFTRDSEGKHADARITGEIHALNDLPATHVVLDSERMRARGATLMQRLAAACRPATASPTVLLVLCSSLSLIARRRPAHMEVACLTLSTLGGAALPSTWSAVSVESLRKRLRSELITLMKHPSSTDWHHELASALNSLGAIRVEYEQFFRGGQSSRKRPADDEEGELGDAGDSSDVLAQTDRQLQQQQLQQQQQQQQQDRKQLHVRINPALMLLDLPIVVELVVAYLAQIPDVQFRTWREQYVDDVRAPSVVQGSVNVGVGRSDISTHNKDTVAGGTAGGGSAATQSGRAGPGTSGAQAPPVQRMVMQPFVLAAEPLEQSTRNELLNDMMSRILQAGDMLRAFGHGTMKNAIMGRLLSTSASMQAEQEPRNAMDSKDDKSHEERLAETSTEPSNTLPLAQDALTQQYLEYVMQNPRHHLESVLVWLFVVRQGDVSV